MSPVPWADAKALLSGAALVSPDRIHWPNDGTFSEPDSGLWLSVTATGDILEPIELGAGAWQEEGRLFVHVLAPAGSGSEDARALAKGVANVYRALGPREVVYFGASIGSGLVSDETGRWWGLTVTINWRWQDFSQP